MASEKPNTEADRDRSKLPLPELPFRGKIGKTYLESEMDWPRVPAPPAGAPNVVVILLDDVGFGQVSTFGGPVPTPALDKLAAVGCVITASTRPRSVARRVRRCSPGAIITIAVRAFWSSGPPGSQVTTA